MSSHCIFDTLLTEIQLQIIYFWTQADFQAGFKDQADYCSFYHDHSTQYSNADQWEDQPNEFVRNWNQKEERCCQRLPSATCNWEWALYECVESANCDSRDFVPPIDQSSCFRIREQVLTLESDLYGVEARLSKPDSTEKESRHCVLERRWDPFSSLIHSLHCHAGCKGLADCFFPNRFPGDLYRREHFSTWMKPFPKFLELTGAVGCYTHHGFCPRVCASCVRGWDN
jgi:hypothetical protein